MPIIEGNYARFTVYRLQGRCQIGSQGSGAESFFLVFGFFVSLVFGGAGSEGVFGWGLAWERHKQDARVKTKITTGR